MACRLRCVAEMRPNLAEHLTYDGEQFWCGLQGLQDRRELRLHALTAHRLSVGTAAARLAQIVWVLCAPPPRPASHHRLAAIRAEHEAAQREIGVDVLARGNFRAFAQPLLYPLICLEADERLVL